MTVTTDGNTTNDQSLEEQAVRACESWLKKTSNTLSPKLIRKRQNPQDGGVTFTFRILKNNQKTPINLEIRQSENQSEIRARLRPWGRFLNEPETLWRLGLD